MTDCGHASHGRYVGGCRCDACRAANAAYERGRVRRRAYGRLDRVDAEPVREHVRYLMRRGYSQKEICRVARIPRTSLRALMSAHHRTGRPVERMSRENAARILAIDGDRRSLGRHQLVQTRMVTDLPRLKAAGVSVAAMSRASGIDRQTLDRIMNKGQRTVRAETHARWMLALPEIEKEASCIRCR